MFDARHFIGPSNWSIDGWDTAENAKSGDIRRGWTPSTYSGGRLDPY